MGPDEKRSIDSSMAELLKRLLDIHWIDGSYLVGEHLKVHFTELGQQSLACFSLSKLPDSLPEAARPRDTNELVCLEILCNLASEL
jgi:hypothetical protein